MAASFLVLFVAHLIGDFVFQSGRLVRAKEGSCLWLLSHAAIVTIITAVTAVWLEPGWNLLPYLWVFLAHLSIDFAKKHFTPGGVRLFIADQAAHITTLLIISYFIPQIGAKSMWLKFGPFYYLQALVLAGGLILCINTGDILISKATIPLLEQITQPQGLENGGKWIGKLERALTFFFMLTGQTGAIGFLFAAKSILRFGETKDHDKRKQTEYIIIGTFMSFGWALLVAWVTNKTLLLWN